MMWKEAMDKLVEVFNASSEFVDSFTAVVFTHPVESDVLIGSFLVGSWILLSRRDRIARSRAFRLIRGTLMKRKDRDKYHKMKLEDAIIDCTMEMVHSGDMTPAEELKWFQKMAKAYDLAGLVPVRDVESIKRGINWRLLQGWFTKPKTMKIGPPPGGPVDPNYKPVFEVARRGLKTSKYATEK